MCYRLNIFIIILVYRISLLCFKTVHTSFAIRNLDPKPLSICFEFYYYFIFKNYFYFFLLRVCFRKKIYIYFFWDTTLNPKIVLIFTGFQNRSRKFGPHVGKKNISFVVDPKWENNKLLSQPFFVMLKQFSN